MSKAKPEALAEAPRLMRAAIARGLDAGEASPIVRDGGDFGAGLVRGFAVITRGEALGHGYWIDEDFLASVAKAMAAAGGLKVRFTHPGMSSDGLGKKLGKAKRSHIDGDVVRGDLHFTKTSHTTPDGDLATHVMNLAEETPEDFGASIVYWPDYAAEEEHYRKHTNKESGRFESPDPLNEKQLPHARLSKLDAVDVVDDPAANPAGMFHATQIPAEADALVAYALGLTSDRPELFELAGIHPDRLKAFTGRFLERRGLTVTKLSDAPAAEPAKPADSPAGEQTPEAKPAETPKPEEKPADPPAAEAPSAEKPEEEKPAEQPPAAETPEAKMSRFRAEFGDADAAVYFSEGLTFEQALTRSHSKLKAENEQLRQQKAAALAAAGEQTPVDATPAGATKPSASLSNPLTDGQALYASTIKLPGR